MIQRIQSVYLALAILSMALMFAFKVSSVSTGSAEAVLTVYGATSGTEAINLSILVIPPFIYNIIIIVALVASILLYKNRKLQRTIGRVSYLLILGFLVFLYVAVDHLSDAVSATDNIKYGAGIYFPIVALVFVFLANRAIKKDEDLVRSLDRLR